MRGQHLPIISESLFYQTQEVLDGRGRNYRPKYKTLDEFPMRGFLACPDCGKLLTGSKSKGRTKYYAYYHCVACKHHSNAEMINEAVLSDSQGILPEIEDRAVYQEVIWTAYSQHTQQTKLGKQQALLQIQEYENRLSYARELLATREIDPI